MVLMMVVKMVLLKVAKMAEKMALMKVEMMVA